MPMPGGIGGISILPGAPGGGGITGGGGRPPIIIGGGGGGPRIPIILAALEGILPFFSLCGLCIMEGGPIAIGGDPIAPGGGP